MNGIFILNGEGISISGNRIQRNGGRASSEFIPDRGVRAGIAIMLAGTGAPSSFEFLEDVLLQGGNNLPSDGSSVRIIDNVVTQLEGRAVHVIAAGPVTISGNFFSSAGFHGSENPEDVFAIGDVVPRREHRRDPGSGSTSKTCPTRAGRIRSSATTSAPSSSPATC
jgi:hypothetical protein